MKKPKKKLLEDAATVADPLANNLGYYNEDDVFLFQNSDDSKAFSERGNYTAEDLVRIREVTGYSNATFMDVSADDTWIFNFETENKLAIMKYNDVMQFSEDEAMTVDQYLNDGIELDNAIYLIDQARPDDNIRIVAPDYNYDTMPDHSIVFVAPYTADEFATESL